MIVSALGLVSPLSQGPAASKKFKDILPLLLGKYKCIRFYSPWGELPKNQAWDSCSQLTSGEDNQGSIPWQHTGETVSNQDVEHSLRRHGLLWACISNSHQPSNIGTYLLRIKKLKLRKVNRFV